MVDETIEQPKTEQPKPTPDPNSMLRKIRRKEHLDGPVLAVPYLKDGSYEHYPLDPAKDEFQLPHDIAEAAIATGHFEEAPDSRTKGKQS